MTLKNSVEEIYESVLQEKYFKIGDVKSESTDPEDWWFNKQEIYNNKQCQVQLYPYSNYKNYYTKLVMYALIDLSLKDDHKITKSITHDIYLMVKEKNHIYKKLIKESAVKRMAKKRIEKNSDENFVDVRKTKLKELSQKIGKFKGVKKIYVEFALERLTPTIVHRERIWKRRAGKEKDEVNSQDLFYLNSKGRRIMKKVLEENYLL